MTAGTHTTEQAIGYWLGALTSTDGVEPYCGFAHDHLDMYVALQERERAVGYGVLDLGDSQWLVRRLRGDGGVDEIHLNFKVNDTWPWWEKITSHRQIAQNAIVLGAWGCVADDAVEVEIVRGGEEREILDEIERRGIAK